MDSIEKEVVEAERHFWDHSSEPGYFDEVMTENALSVIEPMGFIDKESAVRMSHEAAPWRDVRMEDVHTIRLTEDCVALAYHGSARREGDQEEYNVSISSVYVRKHGKWKLALTNHQPWRPRKE